MKGTFVLGGGGVGFCNAVRRALLSDVRAWAPYEVELRVNTSCVTDEFLAHRIGLLAFRRVADGAANEVTLRASGDACAVACAHDLGGVNFAPVHPAVEIVPLGPGQALDLTVRLDRQPASKHARYALCAAVGMEAVDGGRHRVTFETVDDRPPLHVLREALDALDARADAALLQLAQQPAVPPRGMC
tara:strand:+ start:1762 stop:2325 length:564 start_codon:yes stop_codon:yes gene_type:complete